MGPTTDEEFKAVAPSSSLPSPVQSWSAFERDAAARSAASSSSGSGSGSGSSAGLMLPLGSGGANKTGETLFATFCCYYFYL